LLKQLKAIEKQMGRADAERWAPRIIDLDLLLFGDAVIDETDLKVPHPQLLNRSFTLDPLKDLAPMLRIPGTAVPVVHQARKLRTHSPWIMGILNVTPDSFSDGGQTEELEVVAAKIDQMEKSGVHAIDVGAESTRPGATSITQIEESRRLELILKFLRQQYADSIIRPYLSIDTRTPEVAALALDHGFDCINDVSGLSNPMMLDLLSERSCEYVLMHSMSVPADIKVTLPLDCDPVAELKNWLSRKLEMIKGRGIDLNRIIFDPGIGFGKTPQQSMTIMRRIGEFSEFPVRILVGHSRKGFLRSIGISGGKNIDAATLSLSLALAQRGVDILRVHDFESHLAAFKVEAELSQ
jgi:2-amino-4-hydroxy-6-hydroxymethyldihydropteridine diphosphokinase/dihydropteroate synthase